MTSKQIAVFFTVVLTSLLLSPGRLAKAEHALEGKIAPPIKLRTVNGQSFDLRNVKAEVIVLDFWATWCGPCRMGLPLLQEFEDWAQQNEKPVAVLTINLREKRDDVKAYWEKEKFKMAVLMDTSGRVAKQYSVRGIPQTVVIHRGRIARVHVGYSPAMAELLKAEVEKLIGQQDEDRQ